MRGTGRQEGAEDALGRGGNLAGSERAGDALGTRGEPAGSERAGDALGTRGAPAERPCHTPGRRCGLRGKEHESAIFYHAYDLV